MDANATVEENGTVELTESGQQDGNLGDDFLEDFDSCWQDLTDRLTVSRLVSDSVVKGMVNAISQEAHEKITQKELEVSELKKILQSYHLGPDSESTKFLASPLRLCKPKCSEFDRNNSIRGAFFEHDGMTESMCSLKNTAKENFNKLKKEIDRIRGCNSIRKINSGSELVGLGLGGGILQEKASSRCIDVDKIIDDLQDNLDTFYKQVEGIVQLSKASLGQWQVEQEYLADIEGMVIRNYIWSMQQEFEEKLWDQNAKILSTERKISAEKMKEISCLRQELDIILKSLSPEVGHLISYSSMDSDHSHRKLLGNMTPTLHREGNGKHEMSKTNLPGNVDPSRLKHMGKDELINHFNTEMTKMSRNHESQVQEITEENFTLKREILKEREKSSMLKKDREFDLLRRKIPDIIVKLDDVLMENEKLRSSDANDENLGTMRNRLESLISENHHLKDLLGEKKKEIKCLSSQVSSHAEKMSQHSLALSESLITIEKIKCEMQDAQFEASICEDVFKCFLREMMDQSKCATEESAMRYDIMQGIYETVFEGASFVGELASTSENEHLEEESIIMQALLEVVLQESLREAEEKIISLHNRYMQEMSTRLSLEKEVLHCGQALEIEIFKNKKLEAELISSRALLKEKEELVQEITFVLEDEKKKLALACEEVGSLKDQTNSQEILIFKSHEESNTTKRKLTEAMQKVGLLEEENCELKRKLEQAMIEFRNVDEDRRLLVATVSENQDTKLLFEEKEKEYRKQMEMVIFVVQELSKEVFDFEHRVIDYISRNNGRLESLSFETKSLIQDASMVKRDGLIYKQRLEKRCSDLQKAEAEVDLLGDEVDALLRLLEKMYIALDHYSPILKHYPGIVETLKLVKRELRGDTMEAF